MASDTTANYCSTHDRHYGKLEQCAECRGARAASVKTSSPKADTSPVRVAAARYRLNELACWNEFKRYSAIELADDEDKKADPHAAVKFSAEAGKWASRADEMEMKILELEHDQWLVEQKRLLGGGGN